MTSTSYCISDLPINTFIPLYCNQLPTLLPNTSQYFSISSQSTDMTLLRYTISSDYFTFHIETASYISNKICWMLSRESKIINSVGPYNRRSLSPAERGRTFENIISLEFHSKDKTFGLCYCYCSALRV